MNTGPLFVDEFPRLGRGPTLSKVHWAYDGQVLRAVDYDANDEDDKRLRHVFFIGMQAVMITPEEVIGNTVFDSLWMENPHAAILCLGKSSWPQTFNQYHLNKCSHFQILFYDELFDVICEEIDVRAGSYLPHSE